MDLFEGASPKRGFPVLDELPWCENPVAAQGAALGILQSTDRLFAEFAEWHRGLSAEEIRYACRRSIDRKTHQKWFLGEGDSGYMVLLHEYAEPEVFAAQERFAASVHNHRYGFASRVISGGLGVLDFVVDRHAEPVQVRVAKKSRLRIGDTMSLAPDDVHQISMVDTETCTLLIQAPEARNFSVRYFFDGGSQRIYDHEAQVPGLRAKADRLSGE